MQHDLSMVDIYNDVVPRILYEVHPVDNFMSRVNISKARII